MLNVTILPSIFVDKLYPLAGKQVYFPIYFSGISIETSALEISLSPSFKTVNVYLLLISGNSFGFATLISEDVPLGSSTVK